MASLGSQSPHLSQSCDQGFDRGWGLVRRPSWGRIYFHARAVGGKIQSLEGCCTDGLGPYLAVS